MSCRTCDYQLYIRLVTIDGYCIGGLMVAYGLALHQWHIRGPVVAIRDQLMAIRDCQQILVVYEWVIRGLLVTRSWLLVAIRGYWRL